MLYVYMTVYVYISLWTPQYVCMLYMCVYVCCMCVCIYMYMYTYIYVYTVFDLNAEHMPISAQLGNFCDFLQPPLYLYPVYGI